MHRAYQPVYVPLEMGRGIAAEDAGIGVETKPYTLARAGAVASHKLASLP
jgi:hypothetical protein